MCSNLFSVHAHQAGATFGVNSPAPQPAIFRLLNVQPKILNGICSLHPMQTKDSFVHRDYSNTKDEIMLRSVKPYDFLSEVRNLENR